MSGLKACPSCRTDEYVDVFQADTSTLDLEWQVGCSSCGMCGPTSTLKTKAIEAWNNLPRRKEAAE